MKMRRMEKAQKRVTEFVKHLQKKVENCDAVTWTDLQCVIEAFSENFIPNDCERKNGKCLSSAGRLCACYAEGLCKYKPSLT